MKRSIPGITDNKALGKVFGERLKQALFINEMNGTTLADKMGKSVSVVYEWQRGTRFPSIVTLCVIADILKVDVNFLLGRDTKYDKRKSYICKSVKLFVGKCQCGQIVNSNVNFCSKCGRPLEWVNPDMKGIEKVIND